MTKTERAEIAEVVREVLEQGSRDFGLNAQKHAEEMQTFSQSCIDRQLNNRPARPKRTFSVTSQVRGKKVTRKIKGVVDEGEAWAKFCDANKSWPSRRYTRPVIKEVKEVAEVA